MERESHKKSLPQRIFKKIGKTQKKEETFRGRQIAELSMQAVQYIAILKMSGIPMEYWNPDAMNWVLIRWGQKQSTDYRVLFSRYDAFVEETKSGTEKLRLKNQNRQFHHNLKKTALLRPRGVRGSLSGGLHSPLLHLCKYRQNFLCTTDPQYPLLFRSVKFRSLYTLCSGS